MFLKDFLDKWFKPNPKPQRKITVSKITGSNYIDAHKNSEQGRILTEVIDLIKINKMEEVKIKLAELQMTAKDMNKINYRIIDDIIFLWIVN